MWYTLAEQAGKTKMASPTQRQGAQVHKVRYTLAEQARKAKAASRTRRQGEQVAGSAYSAEDHLRIARLQCIAVLLPSKPDYLRELSVVQV